MKPRKLRGVRERSSGLLAYVKVHPGPGGQVSKTFPHGTDPALIQKWQADTRLDLKTAGPAKGTLAADIDKYVAGLTGRRQIDAKGRLKVWTKALGDRPRARITPQDVKATLEGWKGRYQPPTLNRLRQELISLWRTLDGRQHRCPALLVEKYPENPARKGFFEAEKLNAVIAALPPDYRDVVNFLAFSGWRKSEALGLRWEEVDLPGKVIRLSPERSKNREGRTLPITGPLAEIIDRRAASRNGLPCVFYRQQKNGKHKPIAGFRKVWTKTCKDNGCPDAMLHDLRRTVVRNLTRAGVPERVSMGWTGHKTRSVFDRYNIVNEKDLRQAGEQLAAYMGGK